jgi:hypothetical protein
MPEVPLQSQDKKNSSRPQLQYRSLARPLDRRPSLPSDPLPGVAAPLRPMLFARFNPIRYRYSGMSTRLTRLSTLTKPDKTWCIAYHERITHPTDFGPSAMDILVGMLYKDKPQHPFQFTHTPRLQLDFLLTQLDAYSILKLRRRL